MGNTIHFHSVRSGTNSGPMDFSVSLVRGMLGVAFNLGMREGGGRMLEQEREPGKLVIEITGGGVIDKNTYMGNDCDIRILWNTALEVLRLFDVRKEVELGRFILHPEIIPYLKTQYGIPYLAVLITQGLPVIPAAMELDSNEFVAAVELAIEEHYPARAFEQLFS